ncbi:MAG TPA: NAD(P)-binding domain-containing protein, partial [Myxococcaceae bacterium]|nr:NAD(P)-binding domain-containing protein [Myxococcaceae bacterium]
MEPVTWVIAASAVSALLAFLLALRGRRKRRARDLVRYEESVSRGELPLTLHPVIDMDRCIGCLTCVKACPEGDILGEVDGKVMLVAPSHCIGHGRCAAECPSDAIKLVIGTAQRGVELPEISEYFESSRAGVHIIGELGGMGLIKNAMTQGMQVSRHLGKQVAKGSGRPEVSDVLIVGAGPAGLAAALGCREQGLSFRLVDQEKFGGTVANYPRHKLVMSEPVHLPIIGKFGKRSMSKEDLLGAWRKIVKRADIHVEENVKVEGIEGDDGNFAVKSNRGVIRARKVVLATGRRGTPRKLGVPGEDLPKVSYRLLEPEQYQGSRVLVVGGGDSAVEAACQIAEECEDVEVALSYRGDGFNRCREANRQKLQGMIAANRVLPMLGSEVKQITPTHALLKTRGKQVALPNDYVIVCAG